MGGNVSIVTLENSLAVFKKCAQATPYDPAIPLLSISRNENLYPNQNLYMSVHSSFICRSPKLQSAHMFFWQVNG